MRIIVVGLMVIFSCIDFVYADVIGEARMFSANYILELKAKRNSSPVAEGWGRKSNLRLGAASYKEMEKERVRIKRHTWELGPEVYYFIYEEPGMMQEKGIMYGLDGSYNYHQNLMLKVNVRFAYGQVDYKNSGTIDNIDDYTGEVRGLGGYDFSISKTTTLTPYVGMGYRYLNDDTSGKVSSTGAVGYERESNYFYSPIGLETITKLDNDWTLGLIMEYDYFWKGIQRNHLSNADPDFNDLENDQNNGYGARGSVKLYKKCTKLEFIIEPFIRYWNIKKSEEDNVTFSGVIIGTGYEPKNHTIESGVRVAVNF